MTTLITHIYNEEFLLPFWINHHLHNFDEGIVIDFDSSDSSLDIVKELAPHWKIIKSPLKKFEAEPLDRLIENIESSISGARICLNVTEFFMGDAASVVNQKIIPQVSLINMPNDSKFDPSLAFHTQRNFGLVPTSNNHADKDKFPIFSSASGRSIHVQNVIYPLGRHFDLMEPNEMLIYRVSDCFVSEEMLKRRLQVQSKIPKSEHKKSRGNHHTNSGRGLEIQDLLDLEKLAQKYAVNLKGLIDQALFFQNFHKKIRTSVPISPADQKMAWHAVKVNFEIENIPKFCFNTDFGQREKNRLREDYERSLSWKISAPLRTIGSLIRKIKAGFKLK
jgi:hypothetical protein